jgi:hypothetical protein
MLEKQDIAILKGMFEVFRKDITTEMRDETRALIAASENRLRIGLRADIIADIGDLLETSVFVPLKELQKDNLRIKRHIGLA